MISPQPPESRLSEIETRLSEIETRRKRGSFGALAKRAAALHISLDDLAAWLEPQRE
jgi:hypothetical protein